MAINTPTFRKSVGSAAMTATYNTIVYDYFPMITIPNRPIFWDARYSMEWATGKVAYEHAQLLSSGIGTTAVEILTRRIMGGQLKYKTAKNTDVAKKHTDMLKDICEKKLLLTDNTQTAAAKGLAGGTSYYVLNQRGDDLHLDTIGMDQAFCQITGQDVTHAKIFINFIDDNTTGIGSGSRYFLIEERYFDPKNQKPYKINQIYRSNLPQMQGSTQHFSFAWAEDKTTVANLEAGMDTLPENVVKEIERQNIVLGEKIRLPHDDLGIYMFKNTTTDLRHPNSKYGRPLLSSVYDLLWAYDFAFSVLARDLQVGRALTFIPTQMSGNQILSQKMGDKEQGNAYYEMKMEFPALFDDEFVKVPNTKMEYQKPSTVQFDIRADKIKTAMDTIATKIANQVGISPSYFLAMLNQQNETKTATEIASDMSETNLTVMNKRKLLTNALNKVLNSVAKFYGLDPRNSEITFPPLEEMNPNMIADVITKLRQVQGLSDEMLVQIAHPNLSEAEKEEEVTRLKKLKEEKAELKMKEKELKVDETEDIKSNIDNRAKQ